MLIRKTDAEKWGVWIRVRGRKEEEVEGRFKRGRENVKRGISFCLAGVWMGTSMEKIYDSEKKKKKNCRLF